MKNLPLLLLCALLWGCGNPPPIQPQPIAGPPYSAPKSEIVVGTTLVFSNTVPEWVVSQILDAGGKTLYNGSGPPWYFHFDAVDSERKRFAVNAALLLNAHVTTVEVKTNLFTRP